MALRMARLFGGEPRAAENTDFDAPTTQALSAGTARSFRSKRPAANGRAGLGTRSFPWAASSKARPEGG